MTPAMRFETWPLLFGVAAAAIPFVLHLLSSVRAREVRFPTLRFLHISMKKTARRRRIRHWLLLVLRSAMLGLLAVALAEPVTRIAASGGAQGRTSSAVLILDNSLSMSARDRAAAKAPRPLTKFDKAKADAKSLLLGQSKPDAAAVVFTHDTPRPGEPGGEYAFQLSEQLPPLVARIDAAGATAGEAAIADRLRRAVELLVRHKEYDDKTVYVFTDMQKTSLQDLPDLRHAVRAGVRVLFVGDARPPEDVGVADLTAAGRGVVGEELAIEATLVNSSPAEAEASARLIVNDEAVEPQDRRMFVRPAGAAPGMATARFTYTPVRPGPLNVQVVMPGGDDLAEDDRRGLSLMIADRTRVVVVSGPAAPTDPATCAPAAALLLALQPFRGADQAWPIAVTPSEAVEATRFAPADLAGAAAAFFCDVPDFTDAQAAAIARFAAGGGTAVFFLGPNVQPDRWNRLGDAAGPGRGILPGRLKPPVGQLDPDADAQAAARLDTAHRLLAGLYKTPGEYPRVRVRRYFPIELADKLIEAPIRHIRATVDPAGDPLLVVKPFGRGQVVLCATTASPVWSNLCSRPVFLPMVFRMCLAGNVGPLDGHACAPGQKVTIPARPAGPAAGASVRVTTPGGQALTVPAAGGAFVFDATDRLGRYDWTLDGPAADPQGAAGSFVVNPTPAECNLSPIGEKELKDALASHGLKSVYVGAALPAHEAAPPPAEATERNWWDLVLAFVIVLLVVEAVVANRSRGRADDVSPLRA